VCVCVCLFVAWLLRIWPILHSYVRQLVHTCDVCSFICVMWHCPVMGTTSLVYVCVTWHAWFIFIARPIDTRDATHSNKSHKFFHTFHMTPWYLWHDSLIGAGKLHHARFCFGFLSFFLNSIINGICVGIGHFSGPNPELGICVWLCVCVVIFLRYLRVSPCVCVGFCVDGTFDLFHMQSLKR